jgi:hypothetical protein
MSLVLAYLSRRLEQGVVVPFSLGLPGGFPLARGHPSSVPVAERIAPRVQ